jgi:hypothetical protein
MPSLFLPVALSCVLLSAISITEVGLVSSMVGFLHDQRDNIKTYTVNWPDSTIVLNALPAHLLVNQGHETNGAAGYGFVLGLFGLWVARRQRRRDGNVCVSSNPQETTVVNEFQRPSKTLQALAIMLLLSTLLTLSALIYVFVVTNQTDNQTILEAILKLPLAKDSLKGGFRTHVHLMEAWRWFLIPMFIVNLGTLAVGVWAVLTQRREERYAYRNDEK